MGFSIDAVVRDHHIYKEVWIPVVGEELMRPGFMLQWLHANVIQLAMCHVISIAGNIFLRKRSSITCINNYNSKNTFVYP